MPRPDNVREKHQQDKSRLDEYFKGREAQGLGVPQEPCTPRRISFMTISRETGMDAHLLRRKGNNKHIRRWGEKIGFSDIPDTVRLRFQMSARGERRLLFISKLDAYIDRLRRSGKKVPENPYRKGLPHIIRIAGESGVPLSCLVRLNKVRRHLEEGIKELGLGVCTVAEEWEVVTYAQLLKAGGDWRKEELKGRPHAGQQLSNTRSALRKFITGMQGPAGKLLSMEDLVGDELKEGFKKSVGIVASAVKNVKTRRKFITEIERWPDYYQRLVCEMGLPADFRSAFEVVLARTGIGITRLGELAEGPSNTLNQWLAGYLSPSHQSLPFIGRIENVLGLAPKTLSSRLSLKKTKIFQRDDYPEFITVAGEHVKVRHNKGLLSDLRATLPDDFDQRPMQEREEMITWLYTNLITAVGEWRRQHREALTARYIIKELPHVVRGEWDELVAFKRGKLQLEGMQRNGTWTVDTARMRYNSLRTILSALSLSPDANDPRVRGCGISPDRLTIAALVCPKILHWWTRWMGIRRQESFRLTREKDSTEGEEESEKYTLRDANNIYEWASLLSPDTGWLRQRPDLAFHLQPLPGFIDAAFIERAQTSWEDVCQEAFEYYMNLAETVEEASEEMRPTFEPIRPILDSDNPIAALRLFAKNIIDDLPVRHTAPVSVAKHMRGYLIVRILSATALRSKNLRELTYHEDGTGHLRREDGKWVIEIPYNRFKNWQSSFFGTRRKKENYRKVLDDTDGLYDYLEEYIKVHRRTLLKGTASDIFFVASAAKPMFTTGHLHGLYFRLTMTYLAYNPYLGRGIPGVIPHGPHSVRDIVATHIIKKTGSFELAAYAIQDSVRTAKEHYVLFMPKDKIHLVDKILNEDYLSEW